MSTWHDNAIQLEQLAGDHIVISFQFVPFNRRFFGFVVLLFFNMIVPASVLRRWLETAVFKRAANEILWTCKRWTNLIESLNLVHLWRADSTNTIYL